ncbi:MAG TPA: hypothetical protein VGW76_10050 [Pyrinomonadaceae bacterium]|nr:hypothetical protein [Pyrinomonadaceae bacterium]
MKGMLTTTLLLIAMVVPGYNSAGSPQQAQQVIEPGEFHGEEVSAQSGEKWLGLHITDGDHSILLPYRLTVNTVNDSLIDDEGQATGKKVSVDLPLEPLFLIRGLKNVSAGPVSTVFDKVRSASILDESSAITLTLDQASYVLKVAGSEDTAKCPYQSFPRNARLVLLNGKSGQVLYTLQDCGNDPSWKLLWAGDLDRDGKLDLYVSVTQHYNVSERRLFLSSQADEGQLVKEVAEFVTSGC